MEVFMFDLLYVFGTIAFFALMVAYIAGCASLGAVTDAPAEDA
jgi:hypothetical protein